MLGRPCRRPERVVSKGKGQGPGARGQGNQLIRWDIVNVNFATGTVSAGGVASSFANDSSKITLTGNGTGPTGSPTGSGTYDVSGFVSFTLAPGTPPVPNDTIGNSKDTRGGLLVAKIHYSDGSAGTLIVSCHLVGTPDSVFEGVTATKGFVDYWNREAPPAPPANADRTTFHVLH